MLGEPEWQALADIQFLIYRRVADSLNAALSAVALSDMQDAGGQSPAFWRDRATNKVSSVLNLFTAWEYLLRYKMGETVPERAIRPFPVNALLTWLGHQLQLGVTPRVESNPLLHANQETLQEALLLLYSAAFTQGANVRLELETHDRGMWFRIKFARSRPLPETFDELLASFGDHWRARDTMFELTMARDFVQINGSDLVLQSSPGIGEFAFFIWRAGIKRGPLPTLSASQLTSTAQPSAITRVMAEADLPTGEKKPITGPFSRPSITEIAPADTTPVMPRPVGPPSSKEGTDLTPPRLADIRPAHFPLPATVFGPDTRPGDSQDEPGAPAASVPDTTPAVPETTSAVPDTTPAVPETTSAVPETAPAVPETAPAEPKTAPAAAQTPCALESPSTPEQSPTGDPHLAGIIAAPTPHAADLPEPGTARERLPIIITEPAMVGPQPAPTPRLDEILAASPAPDEESNPGEPAAVDEVTPADRSAPAG